LPIPAIVLAIAIGYLLTLGRPLNALALGTEPAAALGIDVQALRRNLFIVTSLMAGVAVAVSGVITAFIGAPVLIVLIRRRPYLYGAAG
jgi:iron complex transport system permease protein